MSDITCTEDSGTTDGRSEAGIGVLGHRHPDTQKMDNILRILIAEDSEGDAALLLRELRKGGYQPVFERVETPEAFRRAIEECGWDIVILDYSMPRFSGMAALGILKELGSDLPAIIVSGKAGEEVAVESMLAGAHDYITKGNLARLIPAIKRELREARDRSERRRFEEALRQSEERLRDIIDNTTAVVYVKDTKGRFTLINSRYEKLFNISRGEIVGKTDHDLFPSETADSFRANDLKVIESGGPMEIEEIVPQHDGVHTYISIKFPLRADNGAIYAICGISTDITERKRTHDALLESEKNLRKAQKIAHIGNWDWEIETDRLTWSEEIYRIFGVDNETFETTYEGFLSRINPEDRKPVMDAVNEGLKGGKPYSVDHRITLPDGSEKVVREQAEIVCNDDGRALRMIGTVQDITDIKRSEKEIEYRAYHDMLTGLPNRSLLMDRLHLAIARCERNEQTLALLFLDLDDFKRINDGMGHTIGDLLIKGASVRLIACLRDVDTVSRFGGDEFLVLLENVGDNGGILETSHRIMTSLSEPYTLDGKEFIVTASIGVACFPGDGDTADELIKNADTAMYHSKELGKNNCQFFTKSMNEKFVKRFELECDLLKAIEKNEILAYYQPRVDMENLRVTGMEALLRWRRRGEKLVSPADFIPLAEETGLIVDLDDWILTASCEFLKKLKDSGFENMVISVNLAARDLERPNLVEIIKKTVNAAGVDPRLIELEVTETTLIKKMSVALAALTQLREMGFSVALDDFGTGYSSLNYLAKFPINILKIDRSFVSSLLTDSTIQTVTKMIISMTRELGIRVIAEGVETTGQLKLLRSLGCHEFQGYLFSPPVPESDMLKLLASGELVVPRF